MKTKRSIAVLILFLYIALIYFSPSAYINKPKFLLLSIVRFPLRTLNQAFYNLNHLLHSKEMIQQNISLNRTVELLTHKLIQHEDTEAENKRLKKLLRFKQKSPFKLIAARIIGKDSSNLSDTIIIGRGRKSGIKKDTVVIAEAGLVGRVSSDSPGISRVMLITDPNSRISAVISRTRQLGICYGLSSNLCRMKYLPLDSDIRLGDEVLTSGFSDIYPKAILIGRVVKIERELRGLSLVAQIDPAVDISKLEEVLCIE